MTNSPTKEEECAICLQKYLQPVILPCSHIFCYLCAKGMVIHSRRCALCRKKIPESYLIKPTVANNVTDFTIVAEHKWYYQGNQGWWQYDDRTNNDVEEAYKDEKEFVKVMISGFIYIIDFQRMMQYREHYPQRCRVIKRDLANIPDKKGIAGLAVEVMNSNVKEVDEENLAVFSNAHSSDQSNEIVIDSDDGNAEREIIGNEDEAQSSNDNNLENNLNNLDLESTAVCDVDVQSI